MFARLTGFSVGVLILALTIGCHPAPPNLDIETTHIWQADQAQVILGELQHTAIQFNKVQVCTAPAGGGAASPADCHPLLSDKNTGVVVDTVTAALHTVHASPQGWQQTSLTALSQISNALDVYGKTQLASYVDAARVALGLILKQPTAAPAAPVIK